MSVGDYHIITMSDAGRYPAEIAERLKLPLGKVYAVLRAQRPKRQRKPRTLTSDIPRKVRGLAAEGIPARRIAVLCKCSRAYVYRILADANESGIR